MIWKKRKGEGKEGFILGRPHNGQLDIYSLSAYSTLCDSGVSWFEHTPFGICTPCPIQQRDESSEGAKG
jgi:hypothetical protein